MRRRPESIRKVAFVILILGLIINAIIFIFDVKEIKEMRNSDPPKSEQIIIPEPQIDTTQ